ncbi:hypothetical protein [Methylobacterium isbiliense]|jgi:hypothetical protein|nr:hypothetical protein [Methylobacterium isbiliense]
MPITTARPLCRRVRDAVRGEGGPDGGTRTRLKAEADVAAFALDQGRLARREQTASDSLGRSGIMRNYLVTFSRIVLDGAGRDRHVVQRRAVIRSRSEVTAAWEAKALFCKAAGIADWRMRADTCEVAELADMAA